MAASSSSASSSLWKFDVFLSFRGEDTRKCFISHLYKELVRKGIKTFRDDEELRKGKSIPPELLQAIGESKFAVVVISRNYASSSWCLDELLEIVKCEESGSLTIVPVFYEVDPSDVKKQKGPFEESFQRHKDNPKVNSDKLQGWKEALTKVATIVGEDSRNWNEDSELIEKIVDEISNQLVSTTSSDFSDLIGMEDHMRALYGLFDFKSTNEVRMIGLWGMPGVGKTTLARYVYEAISQHFQAHCFVEDVKKFYRDHGPARLQELLLSRNLGGSLPIRSSQVGSNVIKARLGHQKVLIVIDDVDDIEQLNVLAKYTDWFGLGSRIIVTTQNKHLLVAHGVEHAYEVKCLIWDRALQLFNLYAFKHKQCLEGFEKFNVQVMNYTGGHPLALKVLGSSLCGRSEEEWESTFCKLEGSLDKGIMDILKVSYDGLDEQEKYIFLCVACLFDGEYVKNLPRILSGNHKKAEIGIQTLAEKSLVDIRTGDIKMHGLLQKMGRELARGWLLTDPEEIIDALMDNEVNKEIEGISLDMSLIKEEKLSVNDEAFERKRNLKFLKIHNGGWVNHEAKVQLASNFSFGDRKLKYLSWVAYPLRTLQSRLDCLVVLKMPRSKLERLWEGPVPLRSLKRIELQDSKNLREIPDLSEAPNLEYLNVSSCESLIEVPSSINGLNKLTFFALNDCSELIQLPRNINLKSLQILELEGCERLNKFPEISQNIRSLTVDLTSDIELPDSIGNMSYLRRLLIYKCKRLKTLPSTMGNIRSLRILRLEGCEMLESIPDTFEELVCLEIFIVVGGRNIRSIPRLPPNITDLEFVGTSIEEVPSWIGNLSKLRVMILKDSRRLKYLPASISKLESLDCFFLDGCSSLENFPAELCDGMRSLTGLDLSNTGMKRLPHNIGNLKSLVIIYIVGKITRGVEQVLSIANLRRLTISNDYYKPDGEPMQCPPLPGFSLLVILDLRNLNMPEIPEDLGRCFPFLEDLDLSGNDFQILPASLKCLSFLRNIFLCNCKNLRSLPKLSRSVAGIYADSCVSLEIASQERCTIACLPRSEVPRCFEHQAKGTYLTIHLSKSHSVRDISRFVTCVVVAAEHHYEIKDLVMDCTSDFRDNYGCSVYRRTITHDLFPSRCTRLYVESEHLFVCEQPIKGLNRKKEVFQDIHLSFNLDYPSNEATLAGLKVKACGAHLLF